jgi:hypothetical protein
MLPKVNIVSASILPHFSREVVDFGHFSLLFEASHLSFPSNPQEPHDLNNARIRQNLKNALNEVRVTKPARFLVSLTSDPGRKSSEF